MKTSIQHINLYELWEATASIIKYISIQILNCFQKLVKPLGLWKSGSQNTKEYHLEQVNI